MENGYGFRQIRVCHSALDCKLQFVTMCLKAKRHTLIDPILSRSCYGTYLILATI